MVGSPIHLQDTTDMPKPETILPTFAAAACETVDSESERAETYRVSAVEKMGRWWGCTGAISP
jgi:hypothetical protein